METQATHIGQTIREQLVFGVNRMKVWSWGANSWTAIENGLAFKVQGFKFKGIVTIVLMGNDTYTIQFIKANKVKKEMSDVYCDEMTDLIDQYVELTDNYKTDVQTAVYTF